MVKRYLVGVAIKQTPRGNGMRQLLSIGCMSILVLCVCIGLLLMIQ